MIQSSLDTLRAARPDYTPRIGHAWPIVEVPSPSSKIPGAGKSASSARQGSLMPGTPAEASQLSKHGATESQPHSDGAKASQENEERQIWEPFAYAFHGTRVEMERRQMQSLAAASAAGIMSNSSSQVAAGSNLQGVGGLRGIEQIGTALGGRLANDGTDNRSRATNAGGELSRRSTGLNTSPVTSPDGSLPSSSAARPALNVPTADAPKLKGVPGPPGKPGHGKKKQRSAWSSLHTRLILRLNRTLSGIEKQAMKQGSVQTPIPATPA
jgi:hypothetical protein